MLLNAANGPRNYFSFSCSSCGRTHLLTVVTDIASCPKIVFFFH